MSELGSQTANSLNYIVVVHGFGIRVAYVTKTAKMHKRFCCLTNVFYIPRLINDLLVVELIILY